MPSIIDSWVCFVVQYDKYSNSWKNWLFLLRPLVKHSGDVSICTGELALLVEGLGVGALSVKDTIGPADERC